MHHGRGFFDQLRIISSFDISAALGGQRYMIVVEPSEYSLNPGDVLPLSQRHFNSFMFLLMQGLDSYR